MQWTSFDDSMIPKVVRETRVSLNPLGDFYLNESAVIALGDPVAVRMLFNKEEGKIGITAAPLKSKGSFQLCTKYGRSAASRKFRALQFCRHLGILPDRTIAFLNPKLENGILVLNLHTTVIAPRSDAPLEPHIREHERGQCPAEASTLLDQGIKLSNSSENISRNISVKLPYQVY